MLKEALGPVPETAHADKWDPTILWEALWEDYGRRSNEGKLGLLLQLNDLKTTTSGTFSDWIAKLQTIKQQLQGFSYKISNLQMVTHILSRVLEKFSTIKTMILGLCNEEDQSLANVI